MGTKTVWRSLTLLNIIGEQYYNEWVGNASFWGLKKVVEATVNLPLFVLLFCIGGVFFVLDYFLGRR